MKTKNILVTGGAGYIGSACAAQLIAQGHHVVVLDNFSTGQRDKVPVGAEALEGDLLDGVTLEKVFSTHAFDVVIHFAAKKAVGESEENPTLYFQNNVVGSLNLLATMAKYRTPHIIFSSTAATYAPKSTNVPFCEDDIVTPPNVYGVTKHIIEQAIQTYVRTGALKQYTILRYFNVAGDAGLLFREMNPQNVFPRIAEALRDNTEFSVFGTDYSTRDGTCIRDYIHLADLVDGHVRAIATRTSGIYNLGTGTGYTVQELITAFEKAAKKKLLVNYSPRRAGDPAIVTANPAKANTELGWHPSHTLDDMVTSCLAVYGI